MLAVFFRCPTNRDYWTESKWARFCVFQKLDFIVSIHEGISFMFFNVSVIDWDNRWVVRTIRQISTFMIYFYYYIRYNSLLATPSALRQSHSDIYGLLKIKLRSNSIMYRNRKSGYRYCKTPEVVVIFTLLLKVIKDTYFLQQTFSWFIYSKVVMFIKNKLVSFHSDIVFGQFVNNYWNFMPQT